MSMCVISLGSTDAHHANHPDEFASPMHRLIHDQIATQAALREVNETVGNHFGNAQQRDSGEQGHHKPVGPGMGRQPPTPVQRDVLPGAFLNGHFVPLQRVISKEVTQDQQDEQVKRLVDRQEPSCHAPKPPRGTVVTVLAPYSS